ncbi:MAG: DUF4124 domain-containing protein [Gammaproteobacteria bacterium]|jgi:hypothetical protein|nr:DUF4124 domain-containing protein [Gammaproteobacteria bacterium]
MRSIFLLAGLLLLPAAHAQEVYRWVDKDGVVHYADQPGDPSAKQVHLATINEAESQPVDAPPPAEDNAPAFEYRSFTLESPTPDQVFQGADATSIPVTLALEGDLSPRHSVVVFLDAQRVAGFSGFSGELPNVARGTHFLRAAILNEQGKALITTAQITFHVRQATVAKPPVGPALRPTPPPTPKPASPPKKP